MTPSRTKALHREVARLQKEVKRFREATAAAHRGADGDMGPPRESGEERLESGLPCPVESSPFGVMDGKHHFPIVALGASAGGYEAVSQFLKYIPKGAGMGFVVVMPLDPTHESQFTRLLSRATTLPVKEISLRTKVLPGHVYVIPPNRRLTIQNGWLELCRRSKESSLSFPIDEFFRSLAQDQGNRAIGVILSSSVKDGILGFKAIRAEGGITFAHDGRPATFDDTPSGAIQKEFIDFVLPPSRIAAEILRLSQHPTFKGLLPGEGASSMNEAGEDFRQIMSLVHLLSGVDFLNYRQCTLQRRVGRRMVLNNIATFGEYAQFLEQNTSELKSLIQGLLVTVTEFFRDRPAFAALRGRILPRIVRGKSAQEPIRIWVPGCSTGEEAYSLAITVHEFLGSRSNSSKIQIIATDFSEEALDKARLGVYPESIEAQVNAERLRRYFRRTEAGYQVVKAIRDLCTFVKQNIGEDPPFAGIDLLSCRDVLIHLVPASQEKLVPMFHFALKPNGFLMLGSSEAIGVCKELFRLIDKRNRIFERTAMTGRLISASLTRRRSELGGLVPPGRTAGSPNARAFASEIDQILLSQYAPVGLVVNSNFEVIHFRGQTGAYLEHSPGEASLKLLKMVRPGLVMALRTALYNAAKSNTLAREDGVRYRLGGEAREVMIEVLPFRVARKTDRFFLILFTETAVLRGRIRAKDSHQAAAPDSREMVREILKARQEIRSANEFLRSIVEEQERTNDELKSANEVIQSSNEELQSTNEELETAKEELQSTNEELTTLNEELQNRNQELGQANNDLNNLISSFHLPILILSEDMLIRRFTPMAEKIFNLIASDVGRPISDINPNFDFPELADLVRDVIDNLNVREIEVQDNVGRWYSLRIRPYRTAENRIEGAVLVLIDIDEIKRGLELITGMIRQPILVLSGDLNVIEANPAFYNKFRLNPADTTGRSIFDLGRGKWNIPVVHNLFEAVLPEKHQVESFKIVHNLGQADSHALLFDIRRLYQPGKRTQLIIAVIEDVVA